MPIPFVPYKKEYQEQIRILAALLEGELHPEKGPGVQVTSPYPRLTGTFQRHSIEIKVLQEITREGSDPLNTVKYLQISANSSCSLEISLGPQGQLMWLRRLFWWRRIGTGDDTLDATYAITSPERKRARQLLAHKKVRNILNLLGPFHSLSLVEERLQLRYLISSHQVFIARRVAEILARLVRLARLCENLT